MEWENRTDIPMPVCQQQGLPDSTLPVSGCGFLEGSCQRVEGEQDAPLTGWAACGAHSVSKHLVKHSWLPGTVLGRKYTKVNKLKSLGGDNLVGRWVKNQVIEI